MWPHRNNVVISYDNGITGQVLQNFDHWFDIKPPRKDAKIYVDDTKYGSLGNEDGGLSWTLVHMTLNKIYQTD
jgi:hypothetical protein